jgi:acyl carrier protein
MKVNLSSKEEIFNVVKDFLVNDFECDPENIKPETKLFEDLDLDSIDAVDLIVKLQQITGKKIDPETFKQVRNIGDVVDAIHKICNS